MATFDHGKFDRGGSGSEWTADLAPSICLDCCTLVARTDQKLLVPTIDVVEEWTREFAGFFSGRWVGC